MRDIQNAYQGFAKQNYTMLDNLKLGYGGTKEEMERLIADANKVKQANGEMADLSIDSFADITKAIHIVQTEMGITGTTAKEASTTIQGSVGMMKASWKNLLVGVADDTQDFGGLMDNFVDSVGTAAKNILPRVETILGGIGRSGRGLGSCSRAGRPAARDDDPARYGIGGRIAAEGVCRQFNRDGTGIVAVGAQRYTDDSCKRSECAAGACG